MAAKKKSPQRKSPAKKTPPIDRGGTTQHADDPDEKADRSIIAKFKLGLRRLCAKQVWAGVEQTMQTDTHDAIAEELAITRSDVTKGIDYGALSLETLIIILSCLEWEYGDLPPLPPYQERCVAGYAEAIAALLGKSSSSDRSPSITMAEFISIVTLLAHQRFHRLAGEGNLTDDTWEEIVGEILPDIARKLELPPEDQELLPYQSATDFQQLYRTWGEAVARCTMAVPNRWAEWLELSK